MKNLLLLTHRIPYPPNKGDKIRSFNILKHLTKEFHVYLGTFIDDIEDRKYVTTVHNMCADTHIATLNPIIKKIYSIRGIAASKPISLPYFFDRGLDQWIKNILSAAKIDYILVFSSVMAQYIEAKMNEIPTIVDFVDVDSYKWLQYSQSKAWPLSWIYKRESTALLKYERHIASLAKSCVFVSKEEAALFKQLVPEASGYVTHISNGVNIEYFTPELEYADPYTVSGPKLVFVGAMDYWANIDAVLWFVREVFPLLKRQISNIQFYIVGARPGSRIKDLQKIAGVSVTGTVYDVRPYLAHADIVIAPMRIARGVQNKVLEAMAMARPIVATTAAAEGLMYEANQDMLLADNVDEWVAAVQTLLQDDRYKNIGVAARCCVKKQYNWSANMEQMVNLLINRESAMRDYDQSQFMGNH